MTYLLGPRRREWLAAVAGPTLFAFDYDGTLAPIVTDRDHAYPRPATRRLLRALAARAPCAILSGRAPADLRCRLDGIAIRHVVGNHGASVAPLGPARAAVTRAMAALRPMIAGLEGVEIEDAGRSLAVHYRGAARPVVARPIVEAAVARASRGMRVLPGKMVVNLVPAGLPDKGDAVASLLRTTGLPRALYVGDDSTDEDVFARAGRLDLVGVHVGQGGPSAAQWFLRRQEEIDDLLRLLLSGRRPRAGSHRPACTST